MKNIKTTEMESRCVHAGIGEYEFGPVVPPIYQTSTFKFENAAHGAALFRGDEKGYIYTRMANPTIEAMENAVADLENGYKALGCASGMAAVHTVFSSLLKQRDHVVCSKAVYGPTATLLATVFSKFGITYTFTDTSDNDNIKAAVKPETRIIYVETPGNPTLDITDIAAAADIAHDNDALLVVDNTFMSPVLQQPLAHGADVVLHSMTKFLNGHADVVAGIVVIKNEDMYSLMRKTLNQTGGVIDPFNAFLVHRGIKTLALRMEKHNKNAGIIAEYLVNHPEIKWVRFPGLKDDPGYDTAQKQQSAAGGMITFELKGGFTAGEILMNSVKFCQLAVSLGGVETLIQHPASMTHLSMGKDAREAAGITEGLVRLSVGIENPEDIIADIESGLQKVKANSNGAHAETGQVRS